MLLQILDWASTVQSYTLPSGYVCVWVCTYVHMGTRMCMWKSEVGIGCHPPLLFPLIFGQHLSLNPELTDRLELARDHQKLTCLHSTPLSLGLQVCETMPGSSVQVLTPARQTLHQLNPFPASSSDPETLTSSSCQALTKDTSLSSFYLITLGWAGQCFKFPLSLGMVD